MMMHKFFIVFLSLIIAIAYVYGQELSIKLTLPLPHSQIAECSNITFAAEVQQQDTIPIDRVRFYRNGASFNTVRTAPYERVWSNAVPGYYEIFAEVEDDSGNVAYSDTTWINIGSITVPNLVSNGTFSCSNTPWSLNLNTSGGAAATWEILDGSWLSDGGIALISIESGGTDSWHVQFHQGVPIDSGHTYLISFLADVSEPRDINVTFQMNQDPWTEYFHQEITLSEAGSYGPYTFECNNTDRGCYLRFNLGTPQGDVYLDDIIVTDANLSAAPDGDVLAQPRQPVHYIISSNYPNPFNGSTTITYQLPISGEVELSIFNLLGQKVTTLAAGIQPAGYHQVTWNAEGFHSGIYIYRIEGRTAQKWHSIARKIVLIK
jgi:hypothetical protein